MKGDLQFPRSSRDCCEAAMGKEGDFFIRVYFAKTFLSSSVVRAAGLVRIFVSSCPTM
jgi:hypothetical protein